MFPPLLSLLVVFLPMTALLPVAALCPTPGQKCTDADIMVAGGDVSVSVLSREMPTDDLRRYLYMRPEATFQGVTLKAQGNHGEYEVWFPLLSQCFSDNSRWWEMKVAVWQDWDSFMFDVIFEVGVDGCPMACKMNILDNVFYKLEVVAHGPSSWKTRPPDASCTTVMLGRKTEITEVTCREPPSQRLPQLCPKFTQSLPSVPPTRPTTTKRPTRFTEPTTSKRPTPPARPTRFTEPTTSKRPTTPKRPTPPSRSRETSSANEPLLLVSVVVTVIVVVVVVAVVVAVGVVMKVRTSLALRTPASEPAVPRPNLAPRAGASPPVPPKRHQEAPRGWPAATPRGPHSPARHWQDSEHVYEEIYCNAA